MKHSSIILFGYLLLSPFCLIFINITDVVRAESDSYFPLGIGTSWRYNSTDDNGDWETRRYIEDDWEFLGLQFTVRFAEERGGEWQNRMWLSKTSNSLVWWGFEDSSAKVIATNGLTYVVDPPEEGAIQGGTTSVTLTLKEEGKTMTADFTGEYTVDNIEDIDVPAGTFKDCIKVHEIEETPDGKADFYVWYAPGIGPIKYSYPRRDNREDVLLEYNIVDDDPFENWLLPYVPLMVIFTIIAVISLIVAVIIIKKRKKQNK